MGVFQPWALGKQVCSGTQWEEFHGIWSWGEEGPRRSGCFSKMTCSELRNGTCQETKQRQQEHCIDRQEVFDRLNGHAKLQMVIDRPEK